MVEELQQRMGQGGQIELWSRENQARGTTPVRWKLKRKGMDTTGHRGECT